MGARGVDISALSVAEVRRSIAQAQARGQTALAEHLQSELAGRRGAPLGHARGEPDDDSDEELGWRPPARTAAAWRGPARAWQLAAAALAGAAAAGAAAWMTTSAGPAQRSAPPAALSPAPRQAAPAPAAPPQPADLAPAGPAGPAGGAAAPAHAHASPASRRPAACHARPTPGSRAVCASRSLSAQDQRMRRAYDRALAAGADRRALDRGQAQWRGLRDRTSNPTRLAHLYRARIAALNAAARPARAHGARRPLRHPKWWPW